jgi:hypothetical protein
MTIATDISAANTAAGQIDETYPIAGRDNNSQGFRDNFDNIKTGMTNVVSALTELNTLTPKLNQDNNFNGQVLENAEIRQIYGSVLSNGSTPTNEFIDARESQYFSFIIANDITLTFSQWPASDKFAKIYIDVRSNGTAQTLDFNTTSGTVRPDTTLTLPYDLGATSTTRYVFEAWTIDGGNNVFLRLIGEFA